MKIIFSLLLSLGIVSVSICTAAADPVKAADQQGAANSQDAKKADSNSQDAKKAESEPAKAQGNSSTESGSGSSTPAAQPAKDDSAAGSSAAVVGENGPDTKQ